MNLAQQVRTEMLISLNASPAWLISSASSFASGYPIRMMQINRVCFRDNHVGSPQRELLTDKALAKPPALLL